MRIVRLGFALASALCASSTSLAQEANTRWINNGRPSKAASAVVCSAPSDLKSDSGAYTCIQMVCASGRLFVEFTTSDVDLPPSFTLKVDGRPFAIRKAGSASEGYRIRAEAPPDLVALVKKANSIWVEETPLRPDFSVFSGKGAAETLSAVEKACGISPATATAAPPPSSPPTSAPGTHSAGKADISAETAKPIDWYTALAFANRGFYEDDERLTKSLKTIFCRSIANTKNEFERRDAMLALRTEIATKLQNFSGTIRNASRRFDLGEYEFKKGGFPVVYRFSYPEYWHVYNFALKAENNQCWSSPNVFPDESALFLRVKPSEFIHFVPVPEAAARKAAEAGAPSLLVTYDLTPASAGIESFGNKRIVVTGTIANVRRQLVDAKGNVIADLK